MSGPGLKNVDSHAAIHEAAIIEAEELNDLLARLLEDEKKDKALKLAYIIVEHWETRTLRHADAEEKGLYKDLVESSPKLKESIMGLTRDHTILRILIDQIKEKLDTEGVGESVLQRFQALILVDLIHNDEEERIIGEHKV
ncbi:MAG TPA: hemerythrin domain-containing protein [Virgibacillus sp.]|nr:hemerythrin domain-containing protein [Virgibacillus sp.]